MGCPAQGMGTLSSAVARGMGSGTLAVGGRGAAGEINRGKRVGGGPSCGVGTLAVL